ncbi:hypothetical protein GCM10022255_069330 [Dactylosporangium darangshiense]|uniref:Uncharacterized protein n=1 Tax=Dactylosporangium darangshiense TaxID=579108 RepID=A0ABP8DI12_9ACTN
MPAATAPRTPNARHGTDRRAPHTGPATGAADHHSAVDWLDRHAAEITRQARRAVAAVPEQRTAALADLRRTVHHLGRLLDKAVDGWPPPPAPDEAP